MPRAVLRSFVLTPLERNACRYPRCCSTATVITPFPPTNNSALPSSGLVARQRLPRDGCTCAHALPPDALAQLVRRRARSRTGRIREPVTMLHDEPLDALPKALQLDPDSWTW